MLGVFSVVFAMLVVAFSVAYAATTIPAPDSLVSAQTTTIYFKDGKTPIGTMAAQNRKSVELSGVADSMEAAIISAEDRSFRTNSGVSPSAIVRAAWSNARGGSTQGGSTITQQYVKNSFDLRDRTISRKAKEFFIALKINRTLDKDVVLRDYLNTIYFGRGAYGIEAASQAYFAVPAAKLTVSQSAFLAGIVKGPELYDPLDGTAAAARAQARWNYVLDGMVEMGTLSTADRATQKFPTVIKPVKANSRAGFRGYLIQMVTAEAAKKAGLTEAQLEQSGLKITTTIDKSMMEQAIVSIDDTLPSKVPAGTKVGMATIDPATGGIMSIYGGPDFISSEYNAATQATLQAGSTFKPFALIAGLKEDIGLRSRFSGISGARYPDTPYAKKGVENFGDKSYSQEVTLLKATANSINSAYVGLNDKVGPENTMKAAIDAGIPANTAGLNDSISNVLGTSSPHVLDMASAYATIAAGGVYRAPHIIASILLPDGKPQYDNAKPAGKRVFDEDVMADAAYAMQGVVQDGSGSYAQKLDREVAGKTGTSTDNASAWFAGFVPQMATAVGMFRDGYGNKLQGFGSFDEITGATYPVRIWTDFMEAALDDTDEVKFPDPAYVGESYNPAPKATYTRRPTPERSSDGDGDGDGSSQTPAPAPTRTAPSSPAPTSTRGSLGDAIDDLINGGRRTATPDDGQ